MFLFTFTGSQIQKGYLSCQTTHTGLSWWVTLSCCMGEEGKKKSLFFLVFDACLTCPNERKPRATEAAIFLSLGTLTADIDTCRWPWQPWFTLPGAISLSVFWLHLLLTLNWCGVTARPRPQEKNCHFESVAYHCVWTTVQVSLAVPQKHADWGLQPSLSEIIHYAFS